MRPSIGDTWGMRKTTLAQIALFLVLFIAAFSTGKVHAAAVGDYDLTESSRLWWIVAFVGLVLVIGYALGLPDKPALRSNIGTALLASVVPPILLALIQTFLGEFVLPRFFLLLSIPMNTLIFFWAATGSQRVTRSNAARERVILIGEEADGGTVLDDLRLHSELPCSIISVILPADLGEDLLISECLKIRPTLVVFPSSIGSNPSAVRQLAEIRSRGIRVRNLEGFYDVFLGKLPLRSVQSVDLLFDVSEVHHPFYMRISRMIDVIVGFVGVVILGVTVPVVIVGNALANRGSLFYSQDRVGKGMQTFTILKFRSMTPGSTTSHLTAQDDPRVTRFGRFLRLSHLDELPQVLNILKGDLSLVGPRPEQPHYVKELALEIPHYGSRHLVRPGLTGWAQVNYPYGADRVDAFEKLQFDLWYLRHQSVLLDLRIIARTLRHVLGFRGR
jgi:lipopolysaccharide/colanic/teichoic acid biosynthesis glycosyltransferase